MAVAGRVSRRRRVVAAALLLAFAAALPAGADETAPSLADEPIAFQSHGEIPRRLPLLLEVGDPFLGTGRLGAGVDLPTGTVWQPRLWVFGTLRSALQSYDSGAAEPVGEWANRLDLFANLQLTGTERLVFGVRPLGDGGPGEFSGYVFEDAPGTGRRWRSAFNADIDALYFEGDFSSLFAGLDPGGMKPIDYGFSIGRQAFVVQNGILLNDTLDAVGVVRNNLRPAGTSNLRLTGVWAWNGVDRNDGRVDPETDLFGLFASADLPKTTLEVDALRVTDRRPDGDGWYLGAAAIQRFGSIATTFRANASFVDGPDTAQIGDGVLLSAEVTWTLPGSDDLVYINPFLAEETFTQAGRDPLAGGPLAALGILFAGSGMGNWRAPLSASARDVIGAALGYQMFWDRARRNLVLEVAGRRATGGGNDDAALGLRFQQKVEKRILLQVDGFYAVQEGRDDAHGGRTEVLVQF